MSTSIPLDLVILEGEQIGAKFSLERGDSIYIGTDLDCDVIVRDPSLADEKMALHIHEDGAELEVVAGTVNIYGRALVAGQSLAISMYEPIHLAATVMAYGEQESAEWFALSQTNSVSIDSDHKDNFSYQKSLKKFLNDRFKIRQFAGFLALSVLLVSSSMIMANKLKTPDIIIDQEEQILGLQKLLDMEGFKHISVMVNDFSEASVVGYVSNYEQYLALEKLLKEIQLQVSTDISVGEKLRSDVQDIYRINGVNVEAEAVGPGIVKINAAEFNSENLETIKSIALKDIEQLEQVMIHNEQSSKINRDNQVVFDSPNKKIIMIVQGDPSYFVTSDQSRYFVGSKLDSGFVIEEINESDILVSRSGMSTRLKI